MSWYKRSEVIKEIQNSYFINEEELGRIFSSLWLELVDIKKEGNTLFCKFKSEKLEGNMLLGTLKNLENILGKLNGVVKVKSKLFDYSVKIVFDKEILD